MANWSRFVAVFFQPCNSAATLSGDERRMNEHTSDMDLATRILVVDDDAGIRDLIADFLQNHGFMVATASDGEHMRALLDRQGFDLIVLDVMMPGEDGLSLLRKLQAAGGPPVIMLSAVGTDVDRIVGLEIGAEDYLSKPCNPRELLARIRTVLRRTRAQPSAPVEAPAVSAVKPAPQAMLTFSGWKLDIVARILFDPEDAIVTLSDGEFRLLKAFVEHPRRVLSRDQLLDYSAGLTSESYDRAIDVQISRLRRKLERGRQQELIRTVRNEGYMFVPPVSTI